eukprot:3820272-Pyramimonas_sp.AAC.1
MSKAAAIKNRTIERFEVSNDSGVSSPNDRTNRGIRGVRTTGTWGFGSVHLTAWAPDSIFAL